MRKLILALAIVGACGFAVRLVAAPSGRPVTTLMTFHPGDVSRWELDDGLEKPDPDLDASHFFFNEDHDVDLNIMRQDYDLAGDLNARGKDALVADLMEGENWVDHAFGAPETKVLDSKVTLDPLVSILTLHTRQERDDGTVEAIEKYFIANGQYLRAEFRWRPEADSKIVKQARADFEAGKLEIDGVTK